MGPPALPHLYQTQVRFCWNKSHIATANCHIDAHWRVSFMSLPDNHWHCGTTNIKRLGVSLIREVRSSSISKDFTQDSDRLLSLESGMSLVYKMAQSLSQGAYCWSRILYPVRRRSSHRPHQGTRSKAKCEITSLWSKKSRESIGWFGIPTQVAIRKISNGWSISRLY